MQKFKFTLQDGNNEEIVFYGGRTSNWDTLDYCEKLEQTASLESQKDFYWVYFAAKQTGNLERLGIDPSASPELAVRHIADTFDVCRIDQAEKAQEDAPLAQPAGE